MKKKEVYMTPEVEITVFEAEDVIRTSGEEFEAGEVLVFDARL